MAEQDDQAARQLAAKNRRLAIALGLLAVGIYLFFIFGYSR